MKINFVNFREYANSKLKIIKEEKTSTYDNFIMSNFGKLTESLSVEKIHEIGNKSKVFLGTTKHLKKAIYKDVQYPYFIYDDKTCIGLDNNGKIIYIDDFIPCNLSSGIIVEDSHRQSDLEAMRRDYMRLRNAAKAGSKEQQTWNDRIDQVNNELQKIYKQGK